MSKIGDRVIIGKTQKGIIQFIGQTEFADGEWYGIKLDDTTGKNDGSVNGKYYFECEPNRGLFCKKAQVRLEDTQVVQQQQQQQPSIPRRTTRASTRSTTSSITKPSSSSTSSITKPSSSSTSTTTTASRRISTSAHHSSSSSSSSSSRLKISEESKTATNNTIDIEQGDNKKSLKPTATTTTTTIGEKPKSRLEELREKQKAAREKVKGNKSKSPTKSPTKSSAIHASSSSSSPSPSPSSSSQDIPRPPAVIYPEEEAVSPSKPGHGRKSSKSDLEISSNLPSPSKNLPPPPLAKRRNSNSSNNNNNNNNNNNTMVDGKEVLRLKKILDDKKNEIESLQKLLHNQREIVKEKDLQIKECDDKIQNFKKEALIKKKKEDENSNSTNGNPTTATTMITSNEKDDQQEEITALTDELDRIKNDLSTKQREYQILEEEKIMLKHTSDEQQGKISQLDSELTMLKEKKLNAQEDEKVKFSDLAKEKALLLAANRKIVEFEKEIEHLNDTVEMLTLDKEQVSLDKEVIEEEVEELKIQLESLKLDMEHQELSIATNNNNNNNNNNNTDTSVLLEQNAKLKAALKKLQEISQSEKSTLSKQVRELEKALGNLENVDVKYQNLKTWKEEKEVELVELRELVDTSNVYADMVEDLTDKNLALDEELIEIRQALTDMEMAQELSEEMEEQQFEEINSLKKDLETMEVNANNIDQLVKEKEEKLLDQTKTLNRFRCLVTDIQQERDSLKEELSSHSQELSEVNNRTRDILNMNQSLRLDARVARKRNVLQAKLNRKSTMNSIRCNRYTALLPKDLLKSENLTIEGELVLCQILSKTAFLLNTINGLYEPFMSSDKKVREDLLKINNETWLEMIERCNHEMQIFSLLFKSFKYAYATISRIYHSEFQVTSKDYINICSLATGIFSDINVILDDLMEVLQEEGGIPLRQFSFSNLKIVVSQIEDMFKALDDTVSQDQEFLWNSINISLSVSCDVNFSLFSCKNLIVQLLAAAEVSGDLSISSIWSPVNNEFIDFIVSFTKEIEKLHQSEDINTNNLDIMKLDYLFLKDKNDDVNNLNKILRGLSNMAINISSKLNEKEALDNIDDKFPATLFENFETIKTQMNNIFTSESKLLLQQTLFSLFNETSIWDVITTNLDYNDNDSNNKSIIPPLKRALEIRDQIKVAIELKSKMEDLKASEYAIREELSIKEKEIEIITAKNEDLELLLERSLSREQSAGESGKENEEIKAKLEKNLKENVELTEALEVLQEQVDIYEKENRTLKTKAEISSTQDTLNGSPMIGSMFNQGGSSSHVPSEIMLRQVETTISSLFKEMNHLRHNKVHETVMSLKPLMNTSLEYKNNFSSKLIEAEFEANVQDADGKNSSDYNNEGPYSLWQNLKQYSNKINKERAAPFIVDLKNKEKVSPKDQLLCHRVDTARISKELRTIKENFVTKLSRNEITESHLSTIKNAKFPNVPISNMFRDHTAVGNQGKARKIGRISFGNRKGEIVPLQVDQNYLEYLSSVFSVQQ